MSNSSVQNMVGEANTHNLTFVLQELNLFPDLIVLAQTVELCFLGWVMSPFCMLSLCSVHTFIRLLITAGCNGLFPLIRLPFLGGQGPLYNAWHMSGKEALSNKYMKDTSTKMSFVNSANTVITIWPLLIQMLEIQRPSQYPEVYGKEWQHMTVSM